MTSHYKKRLQSITQDHLSMRFTIVSGHAAVVGVCWAMMLSCGGKHSRVQEVNHG
jgi:hypothetical protein